MNKEPKIVKILQEHGEVSDEIDYFINMKLIELYGGGFTACQPSLVELEGGLQAIKMGIDYTYIDAKSSEVMGYGIIGSIYLNVENELPKIIYITPKEELDEKIKYIIENGIEAQPRPKGKY